MVCRVTPSRVPISAQLSPEWRPSYGDLLAPREVPLGLADRGQLVEHTTAVIGAQGGLHGVSIC